MFRNSGEKKYSDIIAVSSKCDGIDKNETVNATKINHLQNQKNYVIGRLDNFIEQRYVGI